MIKMWETTHPKSEMQRFWTIVCPTCGIKLQWGSTSEKEEVVDYLLTKEPTGES